MLEVEGGEHEWCMRILRHEAGHAHRQRLQAAPAPPAPEGLRLVRRSRIPSSTRRSPYSKSFVLHLDSWYAQSHPDEDFAETFAVWLTPSSEWRQRYAGLAGAEEARVHGRADAIAARQGAAPRQPGRVDPLRRLRKTLRQHYRDKRRHYGVDYPNFYDRDLRRLFSDAPEFAANITAAQFIAPHPPRRRAASSPSWTGIYQYTIDQVHRRHDRRAAASSSCASPSRRNRRARSSPSS